MFVYNTGEPGSRGSEGRKGRRGDQGLSGLRSATKFCRIGRNNKAIKLTGSDLSRIIVIGS